MNAVPGVICIGEILIDLLSNEPGKSWDKVSSWTPFTGGAPANVAFALRHLGLPVAFAGCIGADTTGLRLHEELKDAGMDVRGVQFDTATPTRQIYVERNADGERFFAGFGGKTSADFADTRFSEAKLPPALFQDYSCLLMGTLLLPYEQSKEAILGCMRLAKLNGMLLAMDVNWRPVFWEDQSLAPPRIIRLMEEMDLIKLSEEEAQWLFKTEDPLVLADRFPKAKVILVSRGEKGCNFLVNGFSGICPAYHVESIDTTGAGDSFMAGFLYQYLTGPEVKSAEHAFEIVQFACALGAICTTVAGAISAETSLATAEDFVKVHQN